MRVRKFKKKLQIKYFYNIYSLIFSLIFKMQKQQFHKFCLKQHEKHVMLPLKCLFYFFILHFIFKDSLFYLFIFKNI